MSTKHEATEKLVGTLLNSFYSASNLLLDAYLLSRINEAVPISVFQSPVRLDRLAADEVVVAKAARQKCGDRVCVSADGSTLASNGKNKPTEKMLRKMREHMLYLEDLPAGTTVKTLYSQFPTIKSIHLPLTSIIHQTCSNGPEVASFDLDWLQLLAFHPQTASPDSPVWSIKLPGFVFVSFDEYYDIENLVELGLGTRKQSLQVGDFAPTLNYLNQELEYIESHSFETSSKTVADFEWEYVRILPMETWHTRTQEYQSLMHKRRSLLDVTMSSRAGSHASGAEYEPGVLITYTGVHKSTSRKVLKQLFELIAPVSYIDHTIHQTNGFVRFKTAQGASRAFHYFSRQCIVQCSPKDIGTLITSSTQLRKIQEKFSNGSKKGSTEVDEEGWGEYGMEFDDDGEEDDNQELVGIKVRILEGREEREYWDSIHQVRTQTQDSQQTWGFPDSSRARNAPMYRAATSSANPKSVTSRLDPTSKLVEGVKSHIKLNGIPAFMPAKTDPRPNSDSTSKHGHPVEKKHTKFSHDESGANVKKPPDINPDKSIKETRKAADVVPKTVIPKFQVIQAKDEKPKDTLNPVDSKSKKRNLEDAIDIQSDEDEGENTGTAKKRRKKKRGKGGKGLVVAQ